jgi:hypothetical protein
MSAHRGKFIILGAQTADRGAVPRPGLSGDEVGVLGMLLDIPGRERAEGCHRQTSFADVVQGTRDESTTNTVALELLGDLGVHEYEPARPLAVVQEAGQSAADSGFEPLLVGVVDDLDRLAGHVRNQPDRSATVFAAGVLGAGQAREELG